MGIVASWGILILIFGLLVLGGLVALAIVLACNSKKTTGKTSVGLIIIASILGFLFVCGLLLCAALIFNIDFGIGAYQEPEQVEDEATLNYIPVAFGKSDYCDILPSQMSRNKEYDICDEDWEFGNKFEAPIYGEDVGIYVHIGNAAYYDRDSQTLYIDFGVSEKSHIGTSKDFSVYLVCPEINSAGNMSKPLTATLRPGESISSVQCDVPDSLDRLTFRIIIYNKIVEPKEFIYSGTIGGDQVGTVIVGDSYYAVVGNENVPSDAWIGDIGSKNVPLYYQLPDDDSSSGDKNDDNDNDVSVDVANSELVGMWTSASRSDDYITTSWYDFHADGTFETGGVEYMHTSTAPELFPGYEDGWHTVPMGFPYTYGTYKVEDDKIILTIKGDSIDFGEGVEPYESILYIRAFGGDRAKFGFFINTIDGEEEIVNEYLKDFEYDKIEELCDELGVDTTP